MASRLAVVVSQAPGLGRYAVGRPPFDGGGERLGGRLLGDVKVTETPGQGGDHPGPLLVMGKGDRLPHIRHTPSTSGGGGSSSKTCCGARQAAAILPAQYSAASRVGTSTTAKPPRCSLVSG